jgi:hypothetical protein
MLDVSRIRLLPRVGFPQKRLDYRLDDWFLPRISTRIVPLAYAVTLEADCLS